MKQELPEADTLEAGSRLGEVVAGKYRLLRLLGRGGMGEVYEAQHVVVGRRFALKFLHAHLARGQGAVTRFMREAQAAGALDNPHLVAVLDFDTVPDGTPFLVMEYLSGEPLSATLRREGRLPLRRALGLLLQVAEGLEVAHRAGIIHRDLKPDNLFVTKQKDGADVIKILDFGIAKLVDADANGRVTQSGAVLGTPFYMAPEQARGQKSIDARVDVYALGVLAYELLSGEKPHPGDGYNAILAHILTQPIAPLRTWCPDVPAALASVIERALAADPAERPASAAALANQLLPFSGRELPMVDSHFDLRAGVSPLTDAPLQTAAGTLESAVGDVPSSEAARPKSSRAAWLLLLVPAAAAAFALLAPHEGRDSAEHGAPLPVAASDSAVHAVASTTSAEAPVLPPPPASASTPPSRKPSPRATTRAPRRAVGAENTFDENNPY